MSELISMLLMDPPGQTSSILKMILEEMVADGDLTPVEQLVLQKEDKQDYEDGFVFERTPDVLTQGHTTLSANRNY